jgi:glycogen phosphorylase
VRLGRVKLYLLDTDLEENAPWDRELSARLYGGDRETRIQQEIILGIGGVRALKAMGSMPAVWHLNEGHAAFVVLQRIRDLIEQGDSFESALEEVRRTTSSRRTRRCRPGTTRSRSPGRDAPGRRWGTLGGYRDAFMALGHYDNGSGPLFNMTALALRTAGASTPSASCTGRSRARCGARSGPASPTSSGPCAPSPTACTCRRGCRRDDAALRRYLPARLARAPRRSGRLGRRVLEIPDEELWAARSRCAVPLRLHPRARARSAGRRSMSAPPASWRPARCSIPTR